MSKLRGLLALLAFVLVGCQSITTSHYRISAATGNRERVDRMLGRFANNVGLSPVPAKEGMEPPPNRFAAYYDPVTNGLSLVAFDRGDTLETLLTERRDFGMRPTGDFDTLEQKLRHEFGSAFGSAVKFHTDTIRPPR